MKDHAILPERRCELILAFDTMRDGAKPTIHGRSLPRYGANASEPNGSQHRLDCRGIGSPPVRRIVVQLAAGIKRCRWPPESHKVHDSLKNQETSSDGRDPFEGEQRMGQVVEHAEKQDDVEDADSLR